MKSIGPAYCRTKGWNAKQLAETSGVSYGYVRRIVNGTLRPSRDVLRRMCAATDQDAATLWARMMALESDDIASGRMERRGSLDSLGKIAERLSIPQDEVPSLAPRPRIASDPESEKDDRNWSDLWKGRIVSLMNSMDRDALLFLYKCAEKIENGKHEKDRQAEKMTDTKTYPLNDSH